MDLTRLRKETASKHSSTEETVPLMKPSLTRVEYADVLRCFFSAVSAWDRWADVHVPADLVPLLAGRRRADLLADDLLALGEAIPQPPEAALRRMEESTVPGDPRSVFLGRMYVMEGSTLGGQYIAKHVEETLGLQRGHGNSYFVGYGDDTAVRWQQFRAVLSAVSDSETETVIASAKNMFSLFGECMRADESSVSIGSNASHFPLEHENASGAVRIRK
jgi:heme oxygenase